MSWAALFAVGTFLPIHTTRFRRTTFGTHTAAVILLASAVTPERLMVEVATEHVTSAELPTYQGIGRSMMMLAITLFAMDNRPTRRSLVAAASISTLFVVGARSELYGFLTVIATISIIQARFSGRALVGTAIAASALTALILTRFDELMVSRQLQVLNLTEASSWIYRRELTSAALDQIIRNPVMGVYAGHFHVQGQGYYSHDLLSAWVSFGPARIPPMRLPLPTLPLGFRAQAASSPDAPTDMGHRLRDEHTPDHTLRPRETNLLGPPRDRVGPNVQRPATRSRV